MGTITVIFIFFNVVILGYLFNHIRTKKRIHNLVEIFFVFMYICLTIILIFPKLLSVIEDVLNIPSAINFIVYLSVFVAYLFIFSLYGRLETQREDITKLVREIALLNGKKKK